jgi:hypothetical protein
LEEGGEAVFSPLTRVPKPCYRTTPEEGGETVFPSAETKVTGPQWSDCARQVILDGST